MAAPRACDGPTVQAAASVLRDGRHRTGDVEVAQIQDTEPGHEVMHMAENGFCERRRAGGAHPGGETEIGGPLPINTDGGLIANGEPIGASGLRQIYEVCLQLRGQAGDRQVPTPRVGYTQVYGAPGVSACTILTR